MVVKTRDSKFVSQIPQRGMWTNVYLKLYKNLIEFSSKEAQRGILD